jgi:hypothetical protein
MQRLVGLFIVLAMFTFVSTLLADGPGNRIARHFGYRWSAGYHQCNPGHDSSYYDPWSGQYGNNSYGSQDSHHSPTTIPQYSAPQHNPSGFYIQQQSGFEWMRLNSTRGFGGAEANMADYRLQNHNAVTSPAQRPSNLQRGFGFPRQR